MTEVAFFFFRLISPEKDISIFIFAIDILYHNIAIHRYIFYPPLMSSYFNAVSRVHLKLIFWNNYFYRKKSSRSQHRNKAIWVSILKETLSINHQSFRSINDQWLNYLHPRLMSEWMNEWIFAAQTECDSLVQNIAIEHPSDWRVKLCSLPFTVGHAALSVHHPPHSQHGRPDEGQEVHRRLWHGGLRGSSVP